MYDDFLIDMVSDAPQNDSQATVRDALKRYFAMHELDRAKDSVVNRVMREIPGSNPNLERQNLELDVQMKRKYLGLQDTEDLDNSMNRHQRGALAALGVNFAQALPDVPKPSPAWMKKLAVSGRLNRFALGIL